MTIKRLAEFFRELGVPKEGRDCKEHDVIPFYLNQLKGKRVAIETSTIVYKQNWAAVLRAIDNYPFIWIDGRGWSSPSEDEVLEIFKRFFKSYIVKIIGSGIIPVFILEGKSPKLKAATIQKRSELRIEMSDKASSVKGNIDLEAFKKKLPYMYMPNTKHMTVIIDILKELKVDTLRAKHEGEGVCAHLVNNVDDPYHCDVALSDDYDIFMYGCRVVVRNLRQASSKVGGFEVTGYAFQDVLFATGFIDPLNYTQEEYEIAIDRFRLFCVLCGTDYSDNVFNMGPARILSMLKNHDIYTYEQACVVEPRFKDIPYADIIDTLKANAIYSVVYPTLTIVPPSVDETLVAVPHTKPAVSVSTLYTSVHMNISSSGKLYMDNLANAHISPTYRTYSAMPISPICATSCSDRYVDVTIICNE